MKVKCGRQGQQYKPESDMKKPESHLVGVRASLDSNHLSITQGCGVSMIDKP